MIRSLIAARGLIVLVSCCWSLSVFAELNTASSAAFVIGDQSWDLLSKAEQESQNMQIYGYRDDEAAPALPPAQALHVHITDNDNDVLNIHEAVNSVYPDAQPKLLINDPAFRLYRTDAKGAKSDLPEMIFITAVFASSLDNKVAIAQYILKPRCAHCLRFAEEWIERFKSARLSENNDTISFDNDSVAIPLHFSQKKKAQIEVTSQTQGWYPWLAESINSTYSRMTAAGSTLLIIGVKIVQNWLGVRGPCGQTVCLCGIPPGR